MLINPKKDFKKVKSDNFDLFYLFAKKVGPACAESQRIQSTTKILRMTDMTTLSTVLGCYSIFHQ